MRTSSAIAGIAILLVSSTLSGCGSDEGPRLIPLTLSIATPNGDDRAVALNIRGPFAGVEGQDGYEVIRGDSSTSAFVVVTPRGRSFATGMPVATVLVEDSVAALSYEIEVLQVAAAHHGLRTATQLEEYRARLGPPK